MLSSVINSQRAIDVNIEIMRTFVKLRRFLLTQAQLERKLVKLEDNLREHDQKIQTIFEAIRQLISSSPEPQRRKIGFHIQERRASYTKKKTKKK